MERQCLFAATVLFVLSSAEGAGVNCSKPCLIYSATNKINAMELNTSRTVIFAANLSRAVALDVHVSERTIYWSDINRRVIQRMNLTSGVIENIITDKLGDIDGLAIEWESHLIYWTDYYYERVEVATLEGKHRKVLIQGGLSNPRGLALYPKKGFLFLTDWGSSPKIERATLAGTQRTVLVDLRNVTQYWPNAVIVDYTEDRIYWIDAWIDAIESCDLYGKHRRKLTNRIHPSFNMHPFDFTVYDDILYWSDWNTDSIERLNLTTAAYLGGLGILTSDRVFGVALLDDSRQPAIAGNHLCKVNNSLCSHLCLLTPGGYQCACPDGLALDSQGKTCVTGAGVNCSKSCLIYSATNRIKAMELPSSRTVTFAANLSRAVALDVHVSERTIYWSDINRRVIQRMNLTSGVIENIITDKLGVVDGLAIEWESHLIYWTDYYYERVEVATLEGKHRKVLIQGGLSNPRGLALYPKKGFLFLTDWGSSPKIERATLAGTQRTVLVDLRNVTQYWPNAVIVDYTEDRIYWIDAWIDAIESCDLYGKHRRKLTNRIHPSFNMHPFDFTVYDDILYWSDWNTDSIERLNLTTAAYLGGLGILTSDRVFGVALLDDSRQPAIAGNHLCKVNNGGCSHLCLLTPGGYQCACPDGLALDSQGKTCVTGAGVNCSKSCLIYSATNKINAMELITSRTVTFAANLSRAVALDVHVSERTIYWSDINRRVIQRMNLTSGVIENIITDKLGVVDGLAIEWETHLIYWTDYSYKRVEVATLEGKHRKLLIQGGLSNPRGLALYPKKGFLFLTDWGLSPKIERATLAGTQRKVLVDLRNVTQHWPNAVIVDYTEDRIYWIDAWLDAIESCDLYGKHRRKLTNRINPSFNMFPFDFTVYDGILYWSDWNTDSIERLNWTTAAYLGGLGILTSDRVFGVALLDDSRQPASAGNQLCKLNTGNCSHLCLLTPDGYQCACPDDLTLDSQGKTCLTGVQAGCSAPCLFYSATNKVKAMELITSRTVTFAANLSRAVALDVHVSERTIYWSDINRRVIQRMNLTSGVIENIITDKLGVVDGLAIEWESHLIYWTDYYYERVEVATLEGKHRKVLIQGGLSNPRGLALYPKKGFLFLTDWGSSPKIERATLAGTQRTVLVDLRNVTQYWPNAVIVDYTEDRIYWIDAWIDAIESCDLYGKHRRKLTNRIHPSFNMFPFDFTVYDDILYWSDWNTDSIERLNLTTAAYLGGLGILTSDRVFGVALLDDSRQPASAGNQLCKLNTGNCSHLCLLTPDGYQCACPDDLTLDSQGKTCLTGVQAGCSAPCLFYSATNKVKAMELITSRTVTFAANLSRAVALDVHVSERTIYWSDINRRVIQRMNLTSGVIENIITDKLGVVDGLAIEWESHLIYWTDYSYKRVEVATIEGKHRKVLIQGGLSNPRGLALYPKKGFLFLTDWGSSPKIERATLAGTQRTVLVDLRNVTQYWPNAVIVDYTEDRIYWIDAWIDAIESCDLYGKHRRKLTNRIHPSFNMHPFDFTVYDDILYWSDWNTDSIERLNLTTAAYLGGLGILTSDRVFGVALLDDSRQPAIAGNHLCKVNNGGCSHLCLLTPGVYQCACPDGLSLDSKRRSCLTGTTLSPLAVSSSVTPFVVSKPILSTVASRETPSLKTISTTVLQSRVQSVLTSESRPGSPSKSTLSQTLSPSVAPTTCRPGTCKNGGTCAETTHTCACQQYYIGYDCSIYVGDVVIKIVLRFTKEGQWDALNFKKTIAIACNRFFCKDGICQSKLTSDGENQNSDESFTPEEIIITRSSLTKENTWELEFVVLFPVSSGKPPKGIPSDEVIKMVEESKDGIQKSLGGSIEAITHTEIKDQSKKTPSQESTQQETASTSTIVAASCVSVVGVAMIAITVFCWRRSHTRRHPNKQATNLPLDNTFFNPVYDEDPTYDYISSTSHDDSSPADATIKEALCAGLNEPRFPGYASPKEITHTYDTLSSDGNKKTHPVYAGLKELHFPQYASPKEITHTFDAPFSGGNEKTHPAVKPFHTDLKGRRLEDNVYTLPTNLDQRTSLRAPLIKNAQAINRDISFSSGEYFSVQAPVHHDYRNLDSTTTGGQEKEAGSQVTPQENGPR